MAKVAVLAVASDAYRFTFANYARLIGVLLVPVVAILAITFGLFLPLMDAMAEVVRSHNPMAVFPLLGQLFLFEIAVFFLVVAATVGVVQLAFGKPVNWPWFALPMLGRDFWRLLGSAALLGVILFAILMVISIVLGIGLTVYLASSGTLPSDPAAMQRAMQSYQPLTLLVTYSAMAAIYVRSAFLLPAVVLGERGLGLSRSWNLARGNFWRLLGLLFLALLPMVALMILNYIVITLAGIPFLAMFDPATGPEAHMAVSMQALHLYMRYWYIYAAVSLLLAPLMYGPWIATSAFAYRALTAGAPAAD